MANDDSVEEYDVLIEGTSLMHAILAAALSFSGLRVVHLDKNDIYGNINMCIPAPFNTATLPPTVTDYQVTPGPALGNLQPAREYNVELSPKLLYAKSAMVGILRNTGISDYVQFKALSSFYLSKNNSFAPVPGSKEDIFTSASIPLIVKRRLMKFIKQCLEAPRDVAELSAGTSLQEVMKREFRLDTDIIEAICYSLARCPSSTTPAADALQILTTHLQSLGVFGPFPVLIAMYGEASELTQAFCRKAAVKGCTYMLGQDYHTPLLPDQINRLRTGHPFRAKHIVPLMEHTPSSTVRCRTLIVQGEVDEMMHGGDGVSIAFAPDQHCSQVIQCRIYGHSAGVCPEGQSVMYLSARNVSDAELTHAQDTIFAKHHLTSIVQLDYSLNEKSYTQSYDDLISEAKEIFHKITRGASEFLPKQAAEEQDD